jgi:hypothetical protein
MNILIWHVHGGWMTPFVQGDHRYLLPTTADEGGRSGYDWPDSAVEVSPGELRDADIDVVVLQRLEELDRVRELLGREPGKDIPAVFVEHNTPRGDVPNAVHPLADRSDITIAHVTHFNDLFWDSGRAPTVVIEHGIVDPGLLYTGELPTLGLVVNEPIRRWRVTGTDLLPAFAEVAGIDNFGIAGGALGSHLGLADRVRFCGDLPPHELHAALARRRAYLHPIRWTSLGLSLLEAMQLGMPVLALGTTEIHRAVPPEAGAVSTDVRELVAAAQHFLEDPDDARARGLVAREVALERYGLATFLRRWDEVLADEVAGFRRRHRVAPQPVS